jgi:hypothetical protein
MFHKIVRTSPSQDTAGLLTTGQKWRMPRSGGTLACVRAINEANTHINPHPSLSHSPVSCSTLAANNSKQSLTLDMSGICRSKLRDSGRWESASSEILANSKSMTGGAMGGSTGNAASSSLIFFSFAAWGLNSARFRTLMMSWLSNLQECPDCVLTPLCVLLECRSQDSGAQGV